MGTTPIWANNGYMPYVDTISRNVFTGRERIILFVLLTSQFMLTLDFSIVTVALPAMGAELSMPTGNLQLVITLFSLASTSLILTMGRVAERVGRKRLFLSGVILLTGASLLGGFAQSQEVLLAARVLQGAAIAITTPTVLALLTTSFAEGPLRTKALSYNGLLMTMGFSAGSLLGGVLTDLLGWRFTFLINVPIGVAVVILAWVLVSDREPLSTKALDVPGAFTITLGLVFFVLWLSQVEKTGFNGLLSYGFLAAGAVLFIIFGIIESRTRHALLPVWFLKQRAVLVGNLGGIVTVSMETAKVFLLTLYLQQVLGATAGVTGLALGVLGLGCMLGGTIAARIITRIGARIALGAGLGLQGLTAMTLVLLGEDFAGSYAHILVATFIGGIGHLVAVVAYSVVGTSGLSNDDQGTATSIVGMSFQIGMLVGIPVMSTIALSQVTPGGASASEMLGGLQLGLFLTGLVVLITSIIVLTVPLSRRDAQKAVTEPASEAVTVPA